MTIYSPTEEERLEKPYYAKEWDKNKKYSISEVEKYIKYIKEIRNNLEDINAAALLYLYICTLEEAINQAKKANKNIIDGRLYRLDYCIPIEEDYDET